MIVALPGFFSYLFLVCNLPHEFWSKPAAPWKRPSRRSLPHLKLQLYVLEFICLNVQELSSLGFKHAGLGQLPIYDIVNPYQMLSPRFYTRPIVAVTIYGSCHAKTCLWAYADSEGPDQPASAQSDQGLHYPLTESSDAIKCTNRERTTGWDFAHARDESESAHFAHNRRQFFAWRAPYQSFTFTLENVSKVLLLRDSLITDDKDTLVISFKYVIWNYVCAF